MNTNESPFGEVIYAYSRSQAVADGVQVEVTKTAQESVSRFSSLAGCMTPTSLCRRT